MRAGRSAEDRLLGMEEARGSNPRQSIKGCVGFGGFEHLFLLEEFWIRVADVLYGFLLVQHGIDSGCVESLVTQHLTDGLQVHFV